MTRKVMEERFKAAILEMYNEAENVAGMKMHFDTYEDFINHLKDDTEKDQWNHTKKVKYLPFMCFFLSKDKQDEIISRATKGCYYTWCWPHKIPIGGDRKFDRYLKELDAYEKEKKNLTPWFRKKRKLELAKKYKLQWRSREAEDMAFSIWNISPTVTEESFEKYKRSYKNKINKKKVDDAHKKEIDGFMYLVKEYKKNHV